MRRADNLTTFKGRLSRHSGSCNLVDPYGPVQTYTQIALSSSLINAYKIEAHGNDFVFILFQILGNSETAGTGFSEPDAR